MRFVVICVLLMTFLLSSCDERGGAPASPAQSSAGYTGDNFAPVMTAYRANLPQDRLRAVAPALPGIDMAPAQSKGFGIHPVSVNRYSADGTAVEAMVLRAEAGEEDLQPVKQLIFGGDYAAEENIQSYRFGVNDKLSLIVENHPEFSGDLKVLADGGVEIPLLRKRVPARGKTHEQLKAGIISILGPYLRNEPVITLNIDFSAGQYYFIMGEVGDSGRYPMGVESVRLSEAVLRANSSDFSDGTRKTKTVENLMEFGPRSGYALPKYADLRRVYVITPHRSRPTRRIYNMKEVLVQGRLADDPIITPGQIIFVPSSIDGRMVRFAERFTAPFGAAQSIDNTGQHWYDRLNRE